MSNNSVILTPAERQGELKRYLTSASVGAALKAIAAKHVTPERLARIACVALSRVPNLLACEPASIVRSLMDAAQLGLEPNTPLKFASIVPYMNGKTKRYEAHLIVEYGGLIQLAHQSGAVDDIYAEVVRARDQFIIRYGTDKKIEHEPNFAAGVDEASNPVIGAYAVAIMKGTPRAKFVYMARPEIDAIRARSPAGNSGPWVSDYAEMAKKTAIRRLWKTLPRSAEKEQLFARAVARADDEQDAPETIDLALEDVEVPPFVEESKPTNGAAALKAKLAATVAVNPQTAPAAVGA